MANEVGAAGFADAGYGDIQILDCWAWGTGEAKRPLLFCTHPKIRHRSPFLSTLGRAFNLRATDLSFDIAADTQVVTSKHRTARTGADHV